MSCLQIETSLMTGNAVLGQVKHSIDFLYPTVCVYDNSVVCAALLESHSGETGFNIRYSPYIHRAHQAFHYIKIGKLVLASPGGGGESLRTVKM